MTSEPSRPASEVHLGSAWNDVLHMWWLVLLIAAVVVAVTFLRPSAHTTHYQASATVAIGQPLTDTGGNLNTIEAHASTAIEIATSNASLKQAAKAADTTTGVISSGLSVTAVSSPIASKLPNPPTLLKVAVTSRHKSVPLPATKAVAAYLLTQTNSFANAKIASLTTQQKQLQQQIALATKQEQSAIANVHAHSGDTAASAIWTSLLNTIQYQLQTYQQTSADNQSALRVSHEIELSKVITPATQVKVATKHRSSSAVVAVVLGLLLGCIVALIVSAALRARRRSAGADDHSATNS